ILNKTIYEFGNHPDSAEMVMPIIEEIVAAAKAKGIHLDSHALLKKVEAAYPKEAQGLHYPSMHQDYTNGRLTEIDYLNGPLDAYGTTCNTPTPTHAMPTHLVHQLESKLQELPKANLIIIMLSTKCLSTLRLYFELNTEADVDLNKNRVAGLLYY